jgi:hypothetical protein
MRKIIFAALFVLALGGCATTGQYGNFVPPTATVDQQQLARDAVQQLARCTRRRKTRLELQQPTPDPFGQALVKSLRDAAMPSWSTTRPARKRRPRRPVSRRRRRPCRCGTCSTRLATRTCTA